MASVKRVRRGPPPRPQKISRLARIKLDGGAHWAAMAKARKARRPGTSLAGALIVGGAAIAGAAWIGGSLFDAREALYAGADSVATAAGLKAEIEVVGVEGERRSEVLAAALPEGRTSIMAASPDRVKDNVESLDWVDTATVSRLWPSTIRITVARRDAFAVWQEGPSLSVVDAAGERVHNARPADFAHLPRIVGADAGPHAEPILRALEDLPALRARVTSVERVARRRWDLHLRNGAVAALPETDPVGALRRLERLQAAQAVLDRRLARIDARADGRFYLQARQAMSAAPASSQRGA